MAVFLVREKENSMRLHTPQNTRTLILLTFLALTLGITLESTKLYADGPLGFKMFRTTPSESQNLELKPEHGPWLIFAISLEGPDSKMQAVKLCAELRQKHNLNAYIMPKTFDFSNGLVGSGINEKGNEKKMRYIDSRVVQSYSILIGDYDSVDAPSTKEALQKVKTINPNFFKTETMAESGDDATAGERVSYLRQWMNMNRDNPESDNNQHPMWMAFMIRNPLLPQEFFEAPELSGIVLDVNKRAEHSILKCPGRFTVRVAQFSGGHTTALGNNYGSGGVANNTASVLEMATLQSAALANLLNRGGVQAFEYHETDSSCVCVGSFDNLGSMDSSGEFQFDSAIREVIQQYGGAKNYQPSQYGTVPVAKTLLDVVNYKKFPELTKGSESEKMAKVQEYSIPFDVVPKPIFVPRPGTKSLYARSLLGQR